MAAGLGRGPHHEQEGTGTIRAVSSEAEGDGPTSPGEPQPDGSPGGDPEELSDRERFERGRVGQTLITYLLLVVLAAMVVQNLPASVVRRDLQTLDNGLHDVGVDQDWTVFAPDPRPVSIRVDARLTYPDGSTERWRIPHSGALVGAYRDYRWQKWQERVDGDEFKGLWEPTARWLVASRTRNGRHPVLVVFSRHAKAVDKLEPQGAPATITPTTATQPGWIDQVFYTYRATRT